MESLYCISHFTAAVGQNRKLIQEMNFVTTRTRTWCVKNLGNCFVFFSEKTCLKRTFITWFIHLWEMHTFVGNIIWGWAASLKSSRSRLPCWYQLCLSWLRSSVNVCTIRASAFFLCAIRLHVMLQLRGLHYHSSPLPALPVWILS